MNSLAIVLMLAMWAQTSATTQTGSVTIAPAHCVSQPALDGCNTCEVCDGQVVSCTLAYCTLAYCTHQNVPQLGGLTTIPNPSEPVDVPAVQEMRHWECTADGASAICVSEVVGEKPEAVSPTAEEAGFDPAEEALFGEQDKF